jgi:hypothetical protein
MQQVTASTFLESLLGHDELKQRLSSLIRKPELREKHLDQGTGKQVGT